MKTHAQQVAETPATGSRLRGTWEIWTREEMGWTMLKHQNYGSFRFRHEISMFHQAETDRFLTKDDFLGLSTIVIHRLWVSAVVREHVTIDQWVNIHLQTEVARSMDVSYLVYTKAQPPIRGSRTQTIKHNQSNLKTLRPLFGVQKYWSRTSKLANEGLSENHLPYTSSHLPVKHKFPYHLMAGVLPTCRHTQI